MESTDSIVDENLVTEGELKIDNAVVNVCLQIDAWELSAGLAKVRVLDGIRARDGRISDIERLLRWHFNNRVVELEGAKRLGRANRNNSLEQLGDVLGV